MKNLRVKTLIFCLLITLTVSNLAQPAYADSKAILASIEESVAADKSIAAYNLEIICRQRMVILKGSVASESDRASIVEIAKSTKGVEEVRDWISVTSSASTGKAPMARLAPASRSDSEIASAIRSAIAADGMAAPKGLTVTVNNGLARLSGDARSFREIDQVLATTLMVSGIRDIESELTINGRPYDAQRFLR